MSQLIPVLAIIGVLAICSAIFVIAIFVVEERERRRQTARMYADRTPSKSLAEPADDDSWTDFRLTSHTTRHHKENP